MTETLSPYILHMNASIYDAAAKILLNSTRTLIILNDNSKVIGVISEGDLLRSILNNENPRVAVSDVMNRAFQSCLETTAVNRHQVLNWLKRGILLVPICDSSGSLVDVVNVMSEANRCL